MTLRKHEVEAILKNCELLEQGAKRYYDEISNLIRRIKEAHVSNETIDEYNCELVNAAIKRFNSESKFAINAITNITPQSKNLSINTNPSKEKIQEFGNAKLYIDDECLCIAIPELFSRNSKIPDKRFSEDVRILLSCNVDRIPIIHHKIIIAINVYPSDYPKHFKVDPDNIDSKAIIDRICDHYNSDCGENTIYTSMIYTTDELPKGTYIMCMPENKMIFQKAKIFNLLRSIICKTDKNSKEK